MNTIYKLYDALLTIKEYCASNNTCNTCKDCPLSDWKLVKPTIIK